MNGLKTRINLAADMPLVDDSYITSNNNLLVRFVSVMKIENCVKLCRINSFTYAGLINS